MTIAKEMTYVTLEEFETMEKDERFNYELIDGVVMMSPSPSREHQKVASILHVTTANQLAKTDCSALYELDIKCNADVFKPDILIFCNEDAELPEIVFEIISPSSKHRDLVVKVAKYAQAGIKEYWIIDPKIKVVTVHDFINHTSENYGIGDTIQSQTIPEVIITVTDIFA